MTKNNFDLSSFLPYLLNQASVLSSQSFEDIYKSKHGLNRAQWRVIANLGAHGAMSATEICKKGHLEKSKVSRAVFSLEENGLLTRQPNKADRRYELLVLTKYGHEIFNELSLDATKHNDWIKAQIGEKDAETLGQILKRLINATKKP